MTPGLLLACLCLLFGCMVCLWLLKPGWPAVCVLLGAGVACRLLFLSLPAADDVARYVWEGRVQLAGHNPYTTPPDSPLLLHLRDGNWQRINHPHYTTIYWPAAQLLFAACAAVAPGELTVKVVLVLFDVGTLFLLVLLCRRLRTEPRHLLLYGLNPLVLIFVAGEGHIEAMMVFWIVLALYLHVLGRHRLSLLSLGLAVMTKLVPIIFLPLLIGRRTLKHAWAFLLPALLSMPYADGLEGALAVPLAFASGFAYNGLAHSLLAVAVPWPLPTLLCCLAAAGLLGLILLLEPQPLNAFRSTAAVFLLFAPTVHPWYLLLITPMLALRPSAAWVTLHLSALPLLFYFNGSVTGSLWHDRWVLFWLEYAPFAAIAVVAIALPLLRRDRMRSPDMSLTVIIPVLNEAANIGPCIASVRSQGHAPQIIVADGGSTDGTADAVRGLGDVTLVRAPRGRGPQIAEALRQAAGDVVLILHADSRLRERSVARMLARLEQQPAVVGGAFGARFGHASARYRLTEALNSARAWLLGVSFGDQAQFFRRSVLAGGFPGYRLMEDVELSLRLKQAGGVTFIPGGVTSSVRRWQQQGYLGNSLGVLWLTLAFLVKRRLGLLSADCSEFYRKYYGN